MRAAWPAVAGGVAVAVLGAAGLVRAAVPQSSGGGHPAGMSAAGPIVVSGAYVQAPVPPTHVSAAYFTVRNTTGTPDKLDSVETGAGPSAVLHIDEPDGSMAPVSGGVTIPAHGSLVLSTGRGHVMIEGVYPSVRVGQSVNIELDFENAGVISVIAPVVAFGASSPTDTTTSGGTHS